jgi:hypothetical protein
MPLAYRCEPVVWRRIDDPPLEPTKSEFLITPDKVWCSGALIFAPELRVFPDSMFTNGQFVWLDGPNIGRSYRITKSKDGAIVVFDQSDYGRMLGWTMQQHINKVIVPWATIRQQGAKMIRQTPRWRRWAARLRTFIRWQIQYRLAALIMPEIEEWQQGDDYDG